MAAKAWYRSAKMDYLSIVVQEELAHACMTELGRLGVLQLVDLNPSKTAFQRRYVAEISRIDAVERRVRYIEEMLEKYQVAPSPAPSTDELLDHLTRRQQEGQTPAALLSDLEGLLSEKERELKTLASLSASLTNEFNKNVELKQVLQKLRAFARDDPNIPEGATSVDPDEGQGPVATQGPDLTLRFRFLAGTIISTEKNNFERMIFRATRGNSYMRFEEISEPIVDPVTAQPVKKSVFVVFFQASNIEEKILSVCRAFQAQTYPLPGIDSAQEISQMVENTEAEIRERSLVTRKSKEDMTRLLMELGRHLLTWKLTLRKEKAVYHSMNLMSADVTGVLRAEGWVVSDKADKVAEVISQVHRRSLAKPLPNWVTVVPDDQRPDKPPTYFATNKFTEAYQLIIDTYGIARYQEVNPALFSTVTFPFCFGVMFGDVGHGFGLLLFSLFLLYKEKSLGKMELNEVAALLYGGRYVLVLMAIFSMYCGFIYNDAMSLGLALFTPTWFKDEATSTNETTYFRRADPPLVYPWGADPTWRIASNEIAFYNSFKMKFAVIFGVIHMLAGLMLKGANAIHFHKKKSGPNLDFWFEAVPQVLFMCLLFGYMDFLIIYKWSIPWGPECTRSVGCQPPSLITTMISMALSPGTVKDPMFEGQGSVQVLLLLLAVACVPIMLCVKPCVLIRRLKKKEKYHGEASIDEPRLGREHRDDVSDGGHSASGLIAREDDHGHGDGHGHEEHGVGDIVIHQAIETIEFILGSISNTASYLRLWALSLAHSQLAAVFWERTLLPFIKSEGSSAIIGTYIGCAVFFAVTFVVLMLMDNLECFLHALRLHWVEFMNKFFKAEGLKFEPLDFDELFEATKKQKVSDAR